jgi:hypothetical protein
MGFLETEDADAVADTDADAAGSAFCGGSISDRSYRDAIGSVVVRRCLFLMDSTFLFFARFCFVIIELLI